MKVSITLILVAFFSISCTEQLPSRKSGYAMAIGGGKRPEYMMERFVEIAGGEKAHIWVIPIASSDPHGVGHYQADQIRTYNPAFVDYIIFDSTAANSDSILGKFEKTTGIFFSGGDQRRIMKILYGSKVLARIKEIYTTGAIIAGTSAGAAVQSGLMITGDELIKKQDDRPFSEIRAGMYELVPGINVIDVGIVDQHFIKRRRHNRLISAVLENPALLGIGIDESTAIILRPDLTIEVIGENQIIIYDAREIVSLHKGKNGLLSARNIKMHILKHGDIFPTKE